MLSLQLRSELWKLFGKKRTYIGFGMFLLAQNIIILLFRYTGATNQMVHTLEGNGYLARDYVSALTIATIMVLVLAYTIMPLYVALVGGDLVAKEAEDGTLRMILSRPISRLRLLALKWLAGLLFSIILVVALGLFGLLFTSFWFSWGGLFVFIPGEVFVVFDAATGLGRYGGAHFFMVAKACTIMSMAFMFSCFNVKPAAATILALSLLLINRILQEIPYFHDFQHWFLTYHLDMWRAVFAENIPWWKVGQSASILLGLNLTFLIVGCAAFQVRDIKS